MKYEIHNFHANCCSDWAFSSEIYYVLCYSSASDVNKDLHKTGTENWNENREQFHLPEKHLFVY